MYVAECRRHEMLNIYRIITIYGTSRAKSEKQWRQSLDNPLGEVIAAVNSH